MDFLEGIPWDKIGGAGSIGLVISMFLIWTFKDIIIQITRGKDSSEDASGREKSPGRKTLIAYTAEKVREEADRSREGYETHVRGEIAGLRSEIYPEVDRKIRDLKQELESEFKERIESLRGLLEQRLSSLEGLSSEERRRIEERINEAFRVMKAHREERNQSLREVREDAKHLARIIDGINTTLITLNSTIRAVRDKTGLTGQFGRRDEKK